MKERVFTACNQLTKQGVKPTLVRVRNELGGGSFSTISPFFRQWKEDRMTHPDPDSNVIDLLNEIATINQKTTLLICKALNNHYHNAKKNQGEAQATLQMKIAKAEVIINQLRMELEYVYREKAVLEKMVSTQGKSRAGKNGYALSING
jgi:hypothetical protein